MTEQYSEDPDAALIPRPAATPEVLRRAVSRITPSRVKEFDRQLVEASTEAQEQQQLGPLHVFCRSWAQHVEIYRFPAVGSRLTELEHVVGSGHPDTDNAVKEISRIVRDADARLRE
ncbi:hypothetical protein GCM10023224_20560 [Streptomonospora halophila]|uniref:Uncharacterized protein n=1 Tax=Streptomonospora halophila TaxID=427369 RepID=A0ABP9GDT6_9ACTN